MLGGLSLLLLDNLEQVLDAAQDIGRLLRLAPDVKILATSRAPLRISSEREYRVPPLAVPAVGSASVDDVERSAAARLYVERARRSVPDFEVTAANAAAIARICQALEGLPLALELAAARVRLLGAEGTADRLGDMLGLLTRGDRDLPERHRSLRATIDWSVRGLDDGARTVFAALGAFSGGATLAAVEAVARGNVEVDVATALDDLLDASLIATSAAAGNEPRFTMLETVREYAAELLEASGDERAVRDRHVSWFLLQAEGESVYWRSPPPFCVCSALSCLPLGDMLALLSRGDRDLPERQRSLRATIDWSVRGLDDGARTVFAALGAFSGGATLAAVEAVAGGDVEVDVVAALDDLLDASLVATSGPAGNEPRFTMLETVREYAAELLELSGDERAVRDRHVAWFLLQAEGEGVYWRRQTDAEWLAQIAADHDNYRAALGHARAAGDFECELRIANALRYFWRVRGYVEEARRRLEEAVQLSAGVEPALRARTLGEAGVMAFAAGDFARSRALWTEARPTLERLGEPREIARALGELGACSAAQGELAEAVPLYRAALERLEGTDDLHGIGVMLGNLAAAYEGLGETAKARDASLDALRLQERIGDDDGIAISNLNMASLEASLGDLDAACGHLRASLAASDRLGYREGALYALGIGAQVAVARGDAETAGLLSGAFEELFGALGAPQAEEAERVRKVRERVAALADLEALLERGRRLAFDEAVSLLRSTLGAAPA